MKILCIIFSILIIICCLFGKGNCDWIDKVQIIADYIEIRNPRISEIKKCEIAYGIAFCSLWSNYPLELLIGVIEAESMFDHKAVSPKGALGLMQIYDCECDGRVFDKKRLFEIEYNIEAGLYILDKKMKIADGDIMKALYSYVGGRKSNKKADKIGKEYVTKVCEAVVDFLLFKMGRI